MNHCFRSAFFLFLGMAVFSACSGRMSLDAALPNEGEPVRLMVDVNREGTKAVDVSESLIYRTLQVLVFNGEALDGYGISNGNLAVVSCTTGKREIWCVVNGEDLSGIKTRSELLSVSASLPESPNELLLIGSVEEIVQDSGTINVEVDRLVSRVVLKGIRNGFADGSDMTLKAIYLINVAGDANYGLDSSYEVSNWYNRRAYESENCIDALMYDSLDVTVAAGETYSVAHYFFCYPNGFPAAVGGPFSPRASLLVIQAEVDGVLYDYPIMLPVMASNCSYEIELVNITRIGNVDNGVAAGSDDDSDEETVVEGLRPSLSVSHSDWNVVNALGEGVNEYIIQ